MSDEEILRYYKNGEEGPAAEYLLRRSGWPQVLIRHVRKHSGSRQDGEDIVMEAFYAFTLQLRRERYQGKGTLRAYYLGIGQKMWLKALRRKRREIAKIESQIRPADDYLTDYLNDVERQDNEEELAVGLQHLSADNQRLLELRLAGYEHKEIAADLGLSDARSARTKFQRVKEHLGRIIRRLPFLSFFF